MSHGRTPRAMPSQEVKHRYMVDVRDIDICKSKMKETNAWGPEALGDARLILLFTDVTVGFMQLAGLVGYSLAPVRWAAGLLVCLSVFLSFFSFLFVSFISLS